MTAAMSALIYCPFPDDASAADVAERLLAEKLIACANIGGAVRSLFVWNGERGEATEVGVLFKTREALLDRAVARIAQLHPYEAPAVLGWRCDTAAEATAKWLSALE